MSDNTTLSNNGSKNSIASNYNDNTQPSKESEKKQKNVQRNRKARDVYTGIQGLYNGAT